MSLGSFLAHQKAETKIYTNLLVSERKVGFISNNIFDFNRSKSIWVHIEYTLSINNSEKP